MALTVTVLSVRPGGLRRQLGMAVRRFQIALVLGGIYVAVSLIIRIAFPSGPIADFGPPVLAALLALAFVLAAGALT